MSQQTYAQLSAAICQPPGCWRTTKMKDANVVANLGGPWKILRLDHHFTHCAPPAKAVSELCDGVAVWPQASNNKLKLLELKQTLKGCSSAKPQLAKGGVLVESVLLTGFSGLSVEAELHVHAAPVSTFKLRDTVMIGSHKVPLRAFLNGKQV